MSGRETTFGWLNPGRLFYRSDSDKLMLKLRCAIGLDNTNAINFEGDKFVVPAGEEVSPIPLKAKVTLSSEDGCNFKVKIKK